ncbi:uncharacterized protein LOC115878282 [Sitophilus oryzae]|uniref:Uncharacterized protein LOC115878282 n=1 Tax=Sitophilus oryzae TaxID=7048 RepID=A0A6J2XHK4_SITOR|nr:uncharacterized protein LOC115878282 [Sitophilus oryzae]
MEMLDKHKKTARKQFEIYLQYIRRYAILKMGWAVQREYTSELSNIWHDMTMKLNDCEGPIRDTSHWKKVFTEWKSHTRRKLKYNRTLNDIEKELIDITGLTGIPDKRRSKLDRSKRNSVQENQKSADRENDRNVSNTNITIKQETPDGWSDTTGTSVIEGEVIDSGSDKVDLKTEQKIVSEEKRDVNKKQIAKRENQNHVAVATTTEKCQRGRIRKVVIVERPHQQQSEKNQTVPMSPREFDQQRVVITTAMNSPHGYASPIPSRREVGIQATETSSGNFNERNLLNIAKLDNALNNLSNAINRYCDIVTRLPF